MPCVALNAVPMSLAHSSVSMLLTARSEQMARKRSPWRVASSVAM